MEIWKVSGSPDSLGHWIIIPFEILKGRKRVDNFFDNSHPPFCVLVLEELRKDDGLRWIVFTKKEADKLFQIGRVFLNPENTSVSCSFLDCILLPVRKSYRKGCSPTYIREDDPNKSAFVKGAPLRLAIQIDE